jgi:hypothetical protein
MTVIVSGFCVEPSDFTATFLFLKTITVSPCKIKVLSNGFVNSAICCMFEFSGLKGKVKLPYLHCSLLKQL